LDVHATILGVDPKRKPHDEEDTMDAAVKEALSKGGIIDITTTGRKTGDARRIEIAYHNFDGHVYISGYPRPEKRRWLLNLEANPSFTFHLKEAVKADLPATARSIQDATERRAILAKVAQTWGRDDMDVIVEQSPLVEVTFGE
jgi:deazaflavin-dependent oxidoreductase (nitroreductase family)